MYESARIGNSDPVETFLGCGERPTGGEEDDGAWILDGAWWMGRRCASAAAAAHHAFKPVSALAISLIARAYANARAPVDLCDLRADVDMDMADGQGWAVGEWKDRVVGEWVKGPAWDEKGLLEDVERVEEVVSSSGWWSGKEEAIPAPISVGPCTGGGGGDVVEDNDAPLAGNEVGVMGPLLTTSAAGSKPFALSSSIRISGLCFLPGSPTMGGGVSRESISPISSIAPPSMSVSSVMEDE